MKVSKNDREDEDRLSKPPDAVLAMVGVGKHLWEQEPGEKFVARLRSEDMPAPPPASRQASAAADLPEAVWQRIKKRQGEQFQTATRLPFTFEVEGNGIWFFREGNRINRKLTRTQVDVAISRCPLSSTTEIKDLIDYPYLFALLMDKRIRAEAW